MKPRYMKDVGEWEVVKATNKAAKKAGFLHRKVVYQGRRGAPDDWYFGPGGRLIVIEHKRPGKEPSEQQAREHRRFRALGFDVRTVSTVAQARRVFEIEDLA